MAKSNLSIGARVKVIRSKSWAGKTGTILEMHPINGYRVMIDTPLPIVCNYTPWFHRSTIRRLTLLESILDWFKN